jgi:hypothetical protein
VDAGARGLFLSAGALLMGIACASRSGDSVDSGTRSSASSSGGYQAPPCDDRVPPYCCASDPACQRCFIATFAVPDAGLDAACEAAACPSCAACPASPPGSNGSSGGGPLVQGPTGCGVGSDDAGKAVLECGYLQLAVPCTN